MIQSGLNLACGMTAKLVCDGRLSTAILLIDLKTRHSNLVVSSLQDLVSVIRHWNACQCVNLFGGDFFCLFLSDSFMSEVLLQQLLIFFTMLIIFLFILLDFFSKDLIQYNVISIRILIREIRLSYGCLVSTMRIIMLENLLQYKGVFWNIQEVTPHSRWHLAGIIWKIPIRFGNLETTIATCIYIMGILIPGKIVFILKQGCTLVYGIV